VKKSIKPFISFASILLASLLIISCSNNNTIGKKVKEPFSSAKYQSSKKYWRAVGKSDSRDENIAKNKADLQAKKELAQQIQTRMKILSDQYFSETETNNSDEVNDQFQSLTREITNVTIGDLRKIGEEKYHNGEKYTVFIAYEIHKRKMLQFMKKKARVDAKIDKKTRKMMEEIIDQEIARSEE